jgi:LmbE family N-acetylglucosaminyl deacetylase
MRSLRLAGPGERLRVLCLGAHADDIEIGAGGTILTWIAQAVALEVHWCVLSASGTRAKEAQGSAAAFLHGAHVALVECTDFADGYFPNDSRAIKHWMEELKGRTEPDVILTHRLEDAHQDHREIARLTWSVFRNHLILSYEIPKWDGDMGRPNLYVPLSADVMARKCALLEQHFPTQRAKDWFDAQTFSGLGRLRGIECRAPENYAEAFWLAKATLG